MKVSGFSFIKNAIIYDYPIVEAITSVLPLCDEFVVAVGDCEDETRSLIENINSPKIRIIDTVWDASLRVGGAVLADETNKALAAISRDSDWAFYIQGDEVLSEEFLPSVKSAMKQHLDDKQVEGLLFNYKHFYGNYRYVADSRRWYRKEIRIIRPNIGIVSCGDAQGFKVRYDTKNGNKERKLRVAPINAYIYHYGWVKPPQTQFNKVVNFNKLWHNEETAATIIENSQLYDYSNVESVTLFDKQHPAVMLPRIERQNLEIHLDTNKKNYTFIRRLVYWIEKITGWRPGEYKNYKIVR